MYSYNFNTNNCWLYNKDNEILNNDFNQEHNFYIKGSKIDNEYRQYYRSKYSKLDLCPGHGSLVNFNPNGFESKHAYVEDKGLGCSWEYWTEELGKQYIDKINYEKTNKMRTDYVEAENKKKYIRYSDDNLESKKAIANEIEKIETDLFKKMSYNHSKSCKIEEDGNDDGIELCSNLKPFNYEYKNYFNDDYNKSYNIGNNTLYNACPIHYPEIESNFCVSSLDKNEKCNPNDDENSSIEKCKICPIGYFRYNYTDNICYQYEFAKLDDREWGDKSGKMYNAQSKEHKCNNGGCEKKIDGMYSRILIRDETCNKGKCCPDGYNELGIGGHSCSKPIVPTNRLAFELYPKQRKVGYGMKTK